MDEPMASQPSSRASSRNSGRSPMPPPTGHGITLNRPLGLSSHTSPYQQSGMGSSSGFSPVPRPGRDYSCPPPARSAFSSRRSSSGVFITSMFGSRFRHLQKLHSDAFVLGLNAVCFPGLPVGTMFRSSLPATPVSTPIHRDVFSHFTEQALRDRLCKTPSPRKAGLRFSPLDTDPCISVQEDVSERVDSSMDITPDICPSTPIEET
jgi:hypothetical protein